MKIKKGDNILVISGKDKGRTGKVFRALPKEGSILIEGINLKKKARKAKKEGEKGQIVDVPSPMDSSNIKIICPKCGKAARVGYSFENKEKFRTCKKCKQRI